MLAFCLSFILCLSLCQQNNAPLKACTSHTVLRDFMTQMMLCKGFKWCVFPESFFVLVYLLQQEGEIQSVKRGLHALFFPWQSQVLSWTKSCQRSLHSKQGCVFQHTMHTVYFSCADFISKCLPEVLIFPGSAFIQCGCVWFILTWMCCCYMFVVIKHVMLFWYLLLVEIYKFNHF